MKKYSVLFGILFIVGCSHITSKKNLKEYVDNAIEIIEKNSIRKDSININNIREQAYLKLKNANTIEDCHTIIKFILKELKDNHSQFLEKSEIEHLDKTPDKLNNFFTFKGEILDEKIGYLEVKGFLNSNSASETIYADSLQELIKSIDSKNITGWIVDLRQNTGGNCWPMLAGLGPLIGDGICGFFVNANKIMHPICYKNGVASLDKEAIIKN